MATYVPTKNRFPCALLPQEPVMGAHEFICFVFITTKGILDYLAAEWYSQPSVADAW